MRVSMRLICLGMVVFWPAVASAGPLGKIGKVVGGGTKILKDTYDAGKDKAKKVVTSTASTVTNVATSVPGAVVNTVSSIPGYLQDRGQDTLDLGVSALEGAGTLLNAGQSAVVDAATTGINVTQDAAGAVVDAAGNAAGAVVDATGNAAGAVVDATGNAAGAVVDAAGNVVEAAAPVVVDGLLIGVGLATMPVWGPALIGAELVEAGAEVTTAVVNAAGGAASEFVEGYKEGYSGEAATTDSFGGGMTGETDAPGQNGSATAQATASGQATVEGSGTATASAAATSEPAGEGTPVSAPAPAPPGPTSYTIQRGDTLTKIATEVQGRMATPPPPPPVSGPGGLIETLARSNAISNPNLIYSGSALRIPTDAELRGKNG